MKIWRFWKRKRSSTFKQICTIFYEMIKMEVSTWNIFAPKKFVLKIHWIFKKMFWSVWSVSLLGRDCQIMETFEQFSDCWKNRQLERSPPASTRLTSFLQVVLKPRFFLLMFPSSFMKQSRKYHVLLWLEGTHSLRRPQIRCTTSPIGS